MEYKYDGMTAGRRYGIEGRYWKKVLRIPRFAVNGVLD
jgi:hypothetical protein